MSGKGMIQAALVFVVILLLSCGWTVNWNLINKEVVTARVIQVGFEPVESWNIFEVFQDSSYPEPNVGFQPGAPFRMIVAVEHEDGTRETIQDEPSYLWFKFGSFANKLELGELYQLTIVGWDSYDLGLRRNIVGYRKVP